MEEVKEKEPKELLYENCALIEGSMSENNFYFYAPKNQLDEDLFNELTNLDLLKKTNCKIVEKIKHCEEFIFCSQYAIGYITLDDEYIKTCDICNLFIPYDMEYYTNNELNYCKLCCPDNTFEKKVMETGFSNLNDWAPIVTIKITK